MTLILRTFSILAKTMPTEWWTSIEEVSFVSFVAPKVLRVMFLLAAWKKKFVSFVKFVVEKTSET